MPFITRSSSTRSGFVDEVALERGHAVFRLDDLVAGLLEDPAGAPPRQTGVVDDAESWRS